MVIDPDLASGLNSGLFVVGGGVYAAQAGCGARPDFLRAGGGPFRRRRGGVAMMIAEMRLRRERPLIAQALTRKIIESPPSLRENGPPT
jgi:hypothetical protein